MSLNINGKKDGSYRYKMPAVETQQIGNGNGCHTMIHNLESIANSISCPQKILLKYIGLSLGTNSNEKKLKINGHHSNDDIQKIIFDYVNNYLICSSCSIPELIPYVEGKKKRKTLHFRCSACGYNCIANDKKKLNNKFNDTIIKYLDKNEWMIKKGMIVKEDSKLSDIMDNFDPFTNIVDL